MATGSPIGEIARSVGWRGDASHKVAEPSQITSLPVIDKTDPVRKNVRTSIDCYVSGTYIGKQGKQFEIKQRYTIFVSYSKGTQYDAMQEARNAIVADFSRKYGQTFNVRDVFVPTLNAPIDDAAPMEMYGGSRTFKGRFPARAKYEVETEKKIASTNIASIRRRYGKI